MPSPNPQPDLGPEGTYTDVERVFISEQPRNLFPTNQNSNYGVLRKVITDQFQEAVDDTTALFNESFVETASVYLGRWEDEAGLPVAPAGLSDASRRVRIASRRKTGAFTRERRNAIIERFISDTFGPPIEITSEGIALVEDGVPLYSEADSIVGTYRVYENGRAYEVMIREDVTPDIPALTRELEWMTPACYSFDIDNSQSEILDYQRLVIGKAPSLYMPFGSDGMTDLSAFVTDADNHSTTNPGTSLLAAGVESDAGARGFSGSGQYVSWRNDGQPKATDPKNYFTYVVWVKPTAAANMTILSKGDNSNKGFRVERTSTGVLSLKSTLAESLIAVSSAGVLPINTVKCVAVRVKGVTVDLFVNGVNVGHTDEITVPIETTDNDLYIGWDETLHRYFTGSMDQFSFWNYPLDDDEIYDLYSTGIGVAAY